ncbi:MAG: anthranilate synthase component I family protein [Phycisphaerae bacterium]
MAHCKLTVQIQAVHNTVDPMRLLEVLALQRGDIAMLHSGNNGNAVLAIKPIVGVLLNVQKGQIRLHTTGIAATADGHGEAISSWTNAWQRWGEILSGISFSRPVPEMLGWLGFISYQAGVMAELPRLYDLDSTETPLAHWQIFERYFIFNASAQQWHLAAVHTDFGSHCDMITDMQAQIHTAETSALPGKPPGKSTLLQQPDASAFKDAVRRCREFIAAGDIYQANISALWTARVAEQGHKIFTRLAQNNPAQYAAFIRFGEDEIICASPELFLKRNGTTLESRPIKGTRPRDIHSSMTDQQRCNELLNSEKDRAELAMIVDLLRNDLGRVCTHVRVEKVREIEKLPTLWHTHGIVTGELPPQVNNGWGDIIAAMCPGGSITGVPKIRAMEIIHELEAQSRGIYCGNIGWISPGGPGALNIAIRTIHLANGIAKIRSGAGITADSNPDEEYAEILVKAAALLRSIIDEL